MIRYLRASWWSQVFALRGGIVVRVLWPVVVYFFYATAMYIGPLWSGVESALEDELSSVKFLGGFVSFLLIFRLNQCHLRYSQGKEETAAFFNTLHGIFCSVSVYLRGAGDRALLACEDPDADLDDLRRAALTALLVKVHVARLVLAIGASLKFHVRVAEHALADGYLESDKVPLLLFDYYRVKGLLLKEEQLLIDEVCGLQLEEYDQGDDGSSAKFFVCMNYKANRCGTFMQADGAGGTMGMALPLILVILLRDYLAQPLCQNWGYPERVMNLMEQQMTVVMRSFEQMDRLVTIPLPMAYLQHCKVLFLLFIMTYPLTIKTEEGFWANVISPCILFYALLGFEILADQMENPLGDDDMDFNLCEMSHELEVRTYQSFIMTETYRERLQKSACEPLVGSSVARRVMELDRTRGDTLRKLHAELCLERDFLFHFSWVQLPPHILEYVSRTRYSGWSCVWRNLDLLGLPSLRARLRDLIKRGTDRIRYEAVSCDTYAWSSAGASKGQTHFLCWKPQEEFLSKVCQLMARHVAVDPFSRESEPAEIWRRDDLAFDVDMDLRPRSQATRTSPVRRTRLHSSFAAAHRQTTNTRKPRVLGYDGLSVLLQDIIDLEGRCHGDEEEDWHFESPRGSQRPSGQQGPSQPEPVEEEEEEFTGRRKGKKITWGDLAGLDLEDGGLASSSVAPAESAASGAGAGAGAVAGAGAGADVVGVPSPTSPPAVVIAPSGAALQLKTQSRAEQELGATGLDRAIAEHSLSAPMLPDRQVSCAE